MTQTHPQFSPGPVQFSDVEEAIEAIKRGEMVIVVDDEDRENEGDLICSAEKITPETINFMVTEARGLICLALTAERCEQLQLLQMVSHNTDPMGTAFTVSVDAHPRHGVTTGISAYDRAKTIQVAVSDEAQPSDLRRPGHIFPLKARSGGVLERVGHTEASVDLARMAGLKPAGVICEVMNPDGSMARRDDLYAMAKRHNLKFVTVAQLINYRLKKERIVRRVATATLPTRWGDFKVIGYKNKLDGSEHLALIKGALHLDPDITPLIRMHSECLTGDLLGSLRCDCGFQLHGALEQIAQHGKGAVVYMRRHEGRGIGLLNKIKAYEYQDNGMDTVEANLEMGFPADLRNYGVGAQILLDLGVTRFNLLTNNPRKIRSLDAYGLEVLERVPIITGHCDTNEHYLRTKQDKLGHLLGFEPKPMPEEVLGPASLADSVSCNPLEV